jgi:hypothetical protein
MPDPLEHDAAEDECCAKDLNRAQPVGQEQNREQDGQERLEVREQGCARRSDAIAKERSRRYV